MKVKKFIVLFFLLNGCATLHMTEAPVVFEDPLARLGVQPVEPTTEEEGGVLLRLIPQEGKAYFREENLIYANIREGRGIRLDLVMDREDTFRPGSLRDSYVLFSETVFQGQKGRLVEEKEMTVRGEILRFIRGFHDSKIGKFKILDWSRTPMFPEGPVKIGDRWSYEEKMEAKIDSFWIKELTPAPHTIKAESTLEGFALVKGARAAVIRTRAVQSKRENFKVLFKKIVFDIETEMEETLYLDYVHGKILGRVTRSRSKTTAANIPLQESGESQSIFYPVDSAEVNP